LGEQKPRVRCVPVAVGSCGPEAVELAASVGLVLDPWEALVLSESLGLGAGGRWAAFEVGLMVSRQNGKGAILEARELAGLFLLDERFIIHSAHQFDTSLEAFRRLLQLIEDSPELDARVQRVSKSHGEEGIELKKNPRTGLRQRIRFRTRTKGGGRGFTADLLILDEAMDLPESTVGALLPTLSARPNPQVWYTGSAVDQEKDENGVAFARIRERGLKGDDPALAFFEWSADVEHPGLVTHEMATDLGIQRRANPGMGIRISGEHIGREQRSMDPRTFAVERLGVGDWPRTDGLAGVVIDPERWSACVDARSVATDPVCFALDVAPDRSRGSIGVSALRADGLQHVEVVEHRRGTGWMADRVAELVAKHDSAGVLVDAAGPVASLLPDLEELGVNVTVVSAKEYAQACGFFYDLVEQRELRHLGSGELTAAVAGAAKRPLSDAWAWSRKTSGTDISPLVAVTLASWASRALGLAGYDGPLLEILA
jgi:hypothetical protein